MRKTPEKITAPRGNITPREIERMAVTSGFRGKFRAIFFLAAMAMMGALSSCGGNGGNGDDGGTDASTDTDADTDTDAGAIDCSNTPYQFGELLAEKCFCPGDGEQTLEVVKPGNPLNGIKATYPAGTFDKCVIAAIGEANFVSSGAVAPNGDDVLVDPQNPNNFNLSSNGMEVRAISAEAPYNSSSPSGYNELQPNKEVTFEIPGKYGTVQKWLTDEERFTTAAPTFVDSSGTKYLTDSFSPYALFNTPFGEYSVSFVPGSVNGYDVNADGALVEINLKDEEQAAFPKWVTFHVTEGSNTYTLAPTGEDGRYRVPIFDGSHTVNFHVADNNPDAPYQHTADQEKAVDLTTDLCADVVCEDDLNLCNGTEGCDPSDGVCKHYSPLVCDDSLACNGAEACIPATGCTNPPDVNCGDHGACAEPAGTCDCDEGIAGDACDQCDTVNGYEGTFPDCEKNLCHDVTCPDDSNVCNGNEVCNPGTGECVHENPLVCDNSDVCDGAETCDPVAGCQPGTPLTCNDNNACNGVETCDSVAGCQAGTPLTCNDNNACNGVETCDTVAGCQSGTPLTCDDNNACNGVETCDTVLGCQAGTPLVCDDNDVCNGVETCDTDLGCQNGTPLTCDDGLACNGVETCDTETGCTNPPDVDCGEHGACVETPVPGACECDTPWSGDNCEIPPPVPTISDLDMHCGAYCDTGLTYTCTFTYTGEITDTNAYVAVTGGATPGTITDIQLDEGNGTCTYHPSINGGGWQETVKIELIGALPGEPGYTVYMEQTNWVF